MALAVGQLDFEAFRESITPEQMDEIEAHILVKWQREEWVSRQQLGIEAGIPLDDLRGHVRVWFEDEDD